MDVTFVLLTYNEEQRLPDCLDSLDGLARQIFVVDSFSDDGTLGLLESRNIPVVQRAFVNYADQRRWAQENIPNPTRWVFHLDADERLSTELRQWLVDEFPAQSALADGFQFSRRTVFMGRWIRWGGHYPTFHLRLFKAALGHCEDKAYDQHFVAEGTVVAVPGKDIIDIVATDLGSFVRSHERWATHEALEQLQLSGAGEIRPALTGNAIERRRWMKINLYERSPLFTRAFLYFVYRYFIRLGFLDGKEGTIFHFLQGFWFRFLVDAKIFELKRTQRARNQP